MDLFSSETKVKNLEKHNPQFATVWTPLNCTLVYLKYRARIPYKFYII